LGSRLQAGLEPARLKSKALRLRWADGVYFNVRLDEERTCVLVLIGATEDGTKELLTVCLEKDKEVLFTFYDFPAQHWPHLRTTNPIESTFATVWLRTHRTKSSGSRIATLTMVFKLGLEA
jgi:transposase-like protein